MTIHIGEIVIIITRIIPMGFQYNASARLFCNNDIIHRVAPQDGQGIPVTCFIIQVLIPWAKLSKLYA